MCIRDRTITTIIIITITIGRITKVVTIIIITVAIIIIIIITTGDPIIIITPIDHQTKAGITNRRNIDEQIMYKPITTLIGGDDTNDKTVSAETRGSIRGGRWRSSSIEGDSRNYDYRPQVNFVQAQDQSDPGRPDTCLLYTSRCV